MLKLKHGLVGWLILALLGLLLSACDSTSPATQTPVVAGTGATGPVSVSIQPDATNSPLVAPTPTVTVAPISQPTATSQPLPTGSVSAREAVIKAVQSLAANSALRYRLVQQGELKSGGSQTQFTADGTGEWQRPAFHQLLTYKESGQTQQLEAFGDDHQLYERVVGLVVWRKGAGPLAGPFPDPGRIAQAGNFAEAGSEVVGQSQTTRYTWQAPVGRLADQVEALGSLSQTGLVAAFNTDSAQAQTTIWVDTKGQLLRYQFRKTLAAEGTTLDYTATYDYTDFNASLTVTPPGDLPKS